MPLNYYWKYQTRLGEARIEFVNQRWRIYLTEEDLGGYDTPEQALDDFTGGHPWSHSTGVDTSTLGLPDELSGWALIKSTRR